MSRKRTFRTVISCVLVVSMLLPYVEAVVPSYSKVLQYDTFVEPYEDAAADYFHTGAASSSDREIAELMACTDISLDDSGRTASVHLEQDAGLTPGEVKSLFGALPYAETDPAETDPVYRLQAEILQIYRIRPEIQMIQDGFGYTYEEIDSAIFYHGDIGTLQKSLKGFLTAEKYYSLRPEEKSDILDLIFGGYTNSQAFAAYVSSSILNKPIQQLIMDKQTEIVEGRACTEEAFLEEDQEEDRRSLAALMGIPYATLEAFLEDSAESLESLKAVYTQTRRHFYRNKNEQQVLSANAAQDAEREYTPEEICDQIRVIIAIRLTKSQGTNSIVYGYDGFNRQTSATVNGVSTSYTYGPDGLRTGKGSVSYVWSGGELVLEGNTRYFYGLDLIAELTDYEFDEVYYFHDAHGNVVTTSHRAINYTANSALEGEDQGAVQRKPDPSEFEYIFSGQEWYDAFGVRDSSIVKSGFGYCGEYQDRETQNYYLRARYYDPTIGRFLAEDTHWNPTNRIYGDNPVEMSSGPIPDVTAVMQSGNLHAYCANNPVMYVDRDGEIGVLATIAIGAGIGALVSGGLQIFKNIKSGETWTKGLGKALLAGGVSGAISVIPIPGVNAWVVVTVTGAAGNLAGQMIAGEVKSAKDVVSALGAGAAAGIIGKGSADLLSKEFQLYFQTLTRAQQKNILNNIGHITNRELTQIRQAFKQGISSTELDELVSRYGYDVIISAFVSSTTATAIQ